MLCRYVVDQLLDQYRLAYSCTAEKSDLTTLLIRAEKIYDLDTGLKHFLRRCLILECRCRSVDRPVLDILRRVDLIDRITQNVEHASERILSDRHADRSARGDCLHTAHKSVRRSHGDTSDRIITQMLGRLNDKLTTVL